MTLEKQLLNEQLKHEMSTQEFSKYLGLSRTWLGLIYGEESNKRPLSKQTMGKIHSRTEIPISVMEEYNKRIEVNRQNGY